MQTIVVFSSLVAFATRTALAQDQPAPSSAPPKTTPAMQGHTTRSDGHGHGESQGNSEAAHGRVAASATTK
jgi:hypothetical protein